MQPLSVRLQDGIRFLPNLVPTLPWSSLTVRLPDIIGRRYGVSVFRIFSDSHLLIRPLSPLPLSACYWQIRIFLTDRPTVPCGYVSNSFAQAGYPTCTYWWEQLPAQLVPKKSLKYATSRRTYLSCMYWRSQLTEQLVCLPDNSTTILSRRTGL